MKLFLASLFTLALVLQGCSKNTVTLDTSKAAKFDPTKDANPKMGGPAEGTESGPLSGKRKGGGTSLPPPK
jgi:hypothetical protein